MIFFMYSPPFVSYDARTTSHSLTLIGPGRFLRLRGRVKEVVDSLRKLRGDLGHGGQLADRGRAHRPRRSEGLEQAGPEGRPDAGDLVQHRADGPPRAELLVIRDGEPVGLVAHLLERLERG